MFPYENFNFLCVDAIDPFRISLLSQSAALSINELVEDRLIPWPPEKNLVPHD